MSEREQVYAGLSNLVNSIRGKNVTSQKKRNLNLVKKRYTKKYEDEAHSLNELEASEIIELLKAVQEASRTVDVKKECYDAVKEIKRRGFTDSNQSLGRMETNINKLRDSFQNLYKGTQLDFANLEKKVSEFYEKHRISTAGIGASDKKKTLTAEQLKELDNIYNNHFKNIGSARTALSNIMSIFPKLKRGERWKLTPKALADSFSGYLHQITGLAYEKEIDTLIKKLSRKGSFRNLNDLESTITGGKFESGVMQKTDVLIDFIPNPSDYEKSIKDLRKGVNISVKSYDLFNSKGISLHGTGKNAILQEWKSKGRLQSNPRASKLIAMASAESLLKVGRNSINTKNKLKDRFGKENISQIESNLNMIFKNTLYYNTDIFLGKDIQVLMGSKTFLTAPEFIETLKNPNSFLYANVGAGSIQVKASLAAEGGR